MGTHYVTEHCDIPFIGESGYNPQSFVTIWSSYALRHNSNIVMSTNTATGEYDAYFKPLDLKVEFRWVNRVLVCLDGRHFFEAARRWAHTHDASDPVYAAQLIPRLTARAIPGRAYHRPEPEDDISAAMVTRGVSKVERQKPKRYREEEDSATTVQRSEEVMETSDEPSTAVQQDDEESVPPEVIDYADSSDDESESDGEPSMEDLYKREQDLDQEVLDSLRTVDGQRLSEKDMEVISQDEPVRLLSPFPEGAILANKKAIETAHIIKEWQRRLGYKSLEKLADSHTNGSIDFPAAHKVTRKQILSADIILGTSNPGGSKADTYTTGMYRLQLKVMWISPLES